MIIVDYTINVSNYRSFSVGSYIKLPKELDHPKKDLINIQNIDDRERFKFCLVRYLHPGDHHPGRLRKIEKDVARGLGFKSVPSILEDLMKKIQ